jgi:hypothetical protein
MEHSVMRVGCSHWLATNALLINNPMNHMGWVCRQEGLSHKVDVPVET